MSRTPSFRSFLGIGSIPHSGIPGPPFGTGIAQDEDMVGSHIQIVPVYFLRHLIVAVENQGRAFMLEKARIAGRRLHHRAVGGQVSIENRRTALGIDGVGERTNNIIVDNDRIP